MSVSFCPSCGIRNIQQSKFCSNCGQRFDGTTAQQQTAASAPADNMRNYPQTYASYGPLRQEELTTRDELLLFAGKEKYLHKWSRSTNWNWSAFFAGMFWMAYRKMYLYAFLFTGAFFLLFLIDDGLGNPGGFRIFYLILDIIMGIMGNRLYYNHAMGKINYARMTFPNPDMRNAAIVKSGGTSVGALFGFTGIFIIVCFLYAAIFYNDFGDDVAPQFAQTERSYNSSSSRSSSSSSPQGTWDYSDVQIRNNSNLLTAMQQLQMLDDESAYYIEPDPAEVYKRPENYYGYIIKISGEVTQVREQQSPQPEQGYAGKVTELVIDNGQGFSTNYILLGTDDQLQPGEQLDLYGYPIGRAKFTDSSGLESEQLVLVGSIYEYADVN